MGEALDRRNHPVIDLDGSGNRQPAEEWSSLGLAAGMFCSHSRSRSTMGMRSLPTPEDDANFKSSISPLVMRIILGSKPLGAVSATKADTNFAS